MPDSGSRGLEPRSMPFYLALSVSLDKKKQRAKIKVA
nr:MAG TPA: hypothetical protein [Caudoviricetes sp.]